MLNAHESKLLFIYQNLHWLDGSMFLKSETINQNEVVHECVFISFKRRIAITLMISLPTEWSSKFILNKIRIGSMD